MAATALTVAGVAAGLAAVHEAAGQSPVPAVAEPVSATPRTPARSVTERSDPSTRDKQPSPGPVAEARPGTPRRLALPALGVDARVVPVNTDNGTLVPPADPRELGWWSEGVKPGSGRGRVLVTGHTVHTGGGALDDLEQLSLGDRVSVRTDRGRLEYVVRSVEYLTIEQVAKQSQRLFRATGPERLVVVTCEGWDGTDYQGNTVVVAEPVA